MKVKDYFKSEVVKPGSNRIYSITGVFIKYTSPREVISRWGNYNIEQTYVSARRSTAGQFLGENVEFKLENV